jgi:hypothetical protein
VFRELARGITVHEIDQMWQDEGFVPGEGSTYNGVGMSRWSDYEANVDWTSWTHVTRVLRVYEQALPAGDAAKEERARIALQLNQNGYLLTNDGRIEPALHYGVGALGPQMSHRITEITRN